MDSFVLPNASAVTIRPIRPDDDRRLQVSHARLSPASRYSRFMTSKPELSVADARYLVDIDGCDHFALVATVDVSNAGAGDGAANGAAPDGAAPDRELIVAVARFVRLPDDPALAEFAIVVNDDWQGQGLGGEMLRRLAAAAAERGVKRFRAIMLADNLPIHRLIERFAGDAMERRRSGTTSEVDFDVSAPAGRSPRRPVSASRRSVSASRGSVSAPAGRSPGPAMIAGCAGS